MAHDNVKELPTGQYDAVRTLRHALQQAENGEIQDVILICSKRHGEVEGCDADPRSFVDLWACWSDMNGVDVLWMQRWFNSWLNRRYFGQHHVDD